MKLFVFDTETTGLPEERYATIYQKEKWPYIVQLSYIIFNTETFEIEEHYNQYINIGENIKLDEEAVKIHGLTRDFLMKYGIKIQDALEQMSKDINKCDLIVGHNVIFDKNVVLVEAIRNDIPVRFKKEYCTMKNGKDICKIEKINAKGEKYFKYPKLIELVKECCKEEPKNLHNSFVDILLCLQCYCKMVLDIDIKEKSESFKLLYEKNCI